MAKIYVWGPASLIAGQKTHLWSFNTMEEVEKFCEANIENAPDGFYVLSLLGTYKKAPTPIVFIPEAEKPDVPS